MKRLRYVDGGLDRIDRAILASLVKDCRKPTAELARAVGLSPPSAAERIRRLEEAGVIEGYAARINPKALGLPLAAWLRIRPLPGKLQEVADILRALPEIVQCDRITGEDCFAARAHVSSVETLEALIDRIIPHAMTNTSIIQSTTVEHRMPPIPGVEA